MTDYMAVGLVVIIGMALTALVLYSLVLPFRYHLTSWDPDELGFGYQFIVIGHILYATITFAAICYVVGYFAVEVIL